MVRQMEKIRKVTNKNLGPSMSVKTVVRNIAVKMYLATSKNHLPKVSFFFILVIITCVSHFRDLYGCKDKKKNPNRQVIRRLFLKDFNNLGDYQVCQPVRVTCAGRNLK